MPRLPGIDKSGAQIGEIIAIGHDASVPPGTLLCDGTSYLRTDYPALFNAIGTRWGTADGTHFNVPNFKGVFLRGHANGSTNDPDRASRTTSATGGASGDAVGSFQTHQYASHSHTVTQDSLVRAPIGASGYQPGGSGFDNAGHVTVNNSGGNETRPTNAYVRYVIAYL